MSRVCALKFALCASRSFVPYHHSSPLTDSNLTPNPAQAFLSHTPIHTCSNMFYQTSAQRAMSVYDIVNEVISHFSPSREHSADLARLALVNLTFSDIAVKHLWEDVDIVHALRLFSGFEVVSADDPTYVSVQFSVAGAMVSQTDWEFVG